MRLNPRRPRRCPRAGATLRSSGTTWPTSSRRHLPRSSGRYAERALRLRASRQTLCRRARGAARAARAVLAPLPLHRSRRRRRARRHGGATSRPPQLVFCSRTHGRFRAQRAESSATPDTCRARSARRANAAPRPSARPCTPLSAVSDVEARPRGPRGQACVGLRRAPTMDHERRASDRRRRLPSESVWRRDFELCGRGS